ncbi:hypothetical protein NON00_19885 [Roseomonas sp. GC11]|uniref:hypothetical protein n=1 Tax=Roseomonas sp. GC11 TaxID=2950546 RepID=UPI00210C2B96|nr:hypothetical protein [Roseomonas sp. GC11]MCQ4162175.1 hypothetical protein [Roseomonas sp. GC11]
MTLTAEVKFTRDHVMASCKAGPGSRLQLTIGHTRVVSLPVAPDEETASLAMPLDLLYGQATLPHELRLLPADGGAELVLPQDALLEAVDIRSNRQFFARVQSNTARMDDTEAARFCCRRLLRNEREDLSARSAALCVLGYRILELGDSTDSDIAELCEEVEPTLAERDESENGIRWRTSVTMMMSYISMLQHDPLQAEEMLKITLSYRSSASRLLSPNYARAELLMASLKLAQGRKEDALDLLSDVETVFRSGVRGSAVEIAGRGYYQYTEIQASLRVVRMAFLLRQRIERAADRKALLALARDPGYRNLSTIMRVLVEKGHLDATIDAMAAASELQAGQPDAGRFAADAAALQEELASAVLEERTEPAEAALPRLLALMAAADQLREDHVFPWTALADLARARFYLGLLLTSAGREDEAAALLGETSPWAKTLLSQVSFGQEADFVPMNQFISIVMMCYLMAHSQVRPVKSYLEGGSRFTAQLLGLVRQNFGPRTPLHDAVTAFTHRCVSRRKAALAAVAG